MQTAGRTYPGDILRVIDGDTLEIRVDLGFYTDHRVKVRLRGINAPEIGTPEGRAAAVWLSGFLAVGGECTVTTYMVRSHEAMSFARYVGDVFLADGRNLAALLIDRGHARVVEA